MQTYTVSSSGTASSGGMSFPIPGTDTTSTVKRTYVARESVTVPAGTFETCHFQEDVTVSGATATTDMWVTVGSGIQIKVISDGDESVTMRASIKGPTINRSQLRHRRPCAALMTATFSCEAIE